MKEFVLHIYDYLSAHKGRAIFLMAVILGICTLLALRMHYEEDITAFLPQSEESKRYSDVYNRLGQDRMAVFFESDGEDTDRLLDAMAAFGENWADVDTVTVTTDGKHATIGRMVPDMQVPADAGAVTEKAA